MGQKVHPYGFRLGFNKTWKSRWFADRDYAKLLHEDLALRQDLKKRFSHAGVSRIETERAANKLKIDIYTSRPGIIIGRKGTEVDKLKQEIQKPELEAQLISESVAVQLEKRVAFRRAMRKAVESALRFGAAPRARFLAPPSGAVIFDGFSVTSTVRCAVRFTTRNARPIGAGRIRF